jgi:predicted RNA-binding protein with RPS1 domain
LAPIHYPRVEDGDQEAIFEKLLELIGQELRVRVINVDEEEKRIILSEREALKEERDKVMAELAVGKIFDGVVSGLSSYGLFVTIGGTVEGLVHISELTYGHVNDVNRLRKSRRQDESKSHWSRKRKDLIVCKTDQRRSMGSYSKKIETRRYYRRRSDQIRSIRSIRESI